MPSTLGVVASHYVPYSGPFTPAQLPGLVGWWDATVTSSLAGTDINTQITAWNDISGAGHHLTTIYTDGTNRLKTINEKSMVALTPANRTDTWLECVGWTRSISETVIAVFTLGPTIPTDGGSYVFVWRDAVGGGNTEHICYYNPGNNTYGAGWNFGFSAPVFPFDHKNHIFAAYHNGPSSWFDIDRVRTTGTNGTAGAPFGFRLGADTWAGWGVAGGYSQAYGEVIVVDGAISAENLTKTYDYLYAKWITVPPIPATGLVGWWDASDTASITSSAGSVSQWNDNWGGKHLTQATSTAQPQLDTINGLNAIKFDGVDDIMKCATCVLTGQTFSMFVVVRSDGVQSNAGGYTGGVVLNGSGAGYAVSLLAGYNTVIAFVKQGVAVYYGTSTSPTSGTHLMFLEGNTTSSSFRFNGLEENSTAGAMPGTSGEIWFGAIPPIFTKGTIGEVIIYNRQLTTVEREQVESYLKNKWGTP